ncbi:MAG TPA: protein-L-isoaspartate O-methyltransferase, partial [Methanobacterium sp.]
MRKNREDLVSNLLNRGYVKTKPVEDAMKKVPREEFMTPETKSYAYL